MTSVDNLADTAHIYTHNVKVKVEYKVCKKAFVDTKIVL